MRVLSIKVPIRKKSWNVFTNPCKKKRTMSGWRTCSSWLKTFVAPSFFCPSWQALDIGALLSCVSSILYLLDKKLWHIQFDRLARIVVNHRLFLIIKMDELFSHPNKQCEASKKPYLCKYHSTHLLSNTLRSLQMNTQPWCNLYISIFVVNAK